MIKTIQSPLVMVLGALSLWLSQAAYAASIGFKDIQAWLNFAKPELHQAIVDRSGIWIVSSQAVTRFHEGRSWGYQLSEDESAIDSLSTHPDEILVLTTKRLMRIHCVRDGLKEEDLLQQGKGRLQYSKLLGESSGVWLYGGTSFSCVKGGRVVRNVPLASKAELQALDGKVMTGPLFSDSISGTIYTVVLTDEKQWRYLLYDEQAGRWACSTNGFQEPAPLVMVNGKVLRLDGSRGEVSFTPSIIFPPSIPDSLRSVRGLYVMLSQGKYLSQHWNNSRGTVDIAEIDLKTKPNVKSLYFTQIGEPISMYADDCRIYYWPTAMNWQDSSSIVTCK